MTSKLAPDTAWQAVLQELEQQMDRATFVAWLQDARLLRVAEGGAWVVGVRNEQAREWVTARLQEGIEQAVAALAGEGVAVTFEVAAPPAAPCLDPAGSTGGGNGGGDPGGGGANFPGFAPITSNFTTTPNQYFEVVLPEGPPSLAAFVGAVIHGTIGQIVNWHTGERQEWWEASYSEIMAAAGLSKGSVVTAVRGAVEKGYVVREPAGQSFRYRLRRVGEPIGTFP